MMYIEKHLAKLSDSRKTILNDLETLAGSGVLVDSISINKVQEVREWVELRFTPRNSEEKGVGLLYDRIATMFVKNPQKPIYKNFNIGSIFFQEFESLNGEERLIQGIGPNLKVQFQVMFDRSAGLHSLPLQTIELQIREDIKRLSKDPLLDLSTTKMETLKTSGGDFSVRFLVYLAAADPLVRAFRRLASKYWNGELADSCKFLKIIKIGLWEHFEKDSSKISAVRSAPKEIPVPPLTIQPTPQYFLFRSFLSPSDVHIL
ncbi:hypothetical protein DL96DRAFT_870856 [Flagelloscypha sp. PMI_526]|nr:hypothetical protein DL96DRAFT_870856 [Flagelloscypha sp. PMI_526]